jgi:hypothetical protein
MEHPVFEPSAAARQPLRSAVEYSRLTQPLPGSASLPRLETRNGAYELKFILQDSQVDEIVGWAQAHLAADPHAARSGDETYWIHSVYLDTDELAVYHRRPGFQCSKFRLRRYGCDEVIFLEEKRNDQGWVTKVRSRITDAELALLHADSVPADWPGAWFRQALVEQQLVPCCRVTYRRLAREGETDGAPVRLTIDREIYCASTSELRPGQGNEPGVPIPYAVLELKFRNGLPRLFKELIHNLGLSPVGASKYRNAAEVCGIALPE